MPMPKFIYHYTNIEALINGILNHKINDSERDNEICPWATPAYWVSPNKRRILLKTLE